MILGRSTYAWVLLACLVAWRGTEVFSTDLRRSVPEVPLAPKAPNLWKTPPSPSRQDQRPPIFRAGTTFVRVDAYPRRDGRIVEGLTAKDFQIFENGQPQAVESFEFVKVPPHTPDAELRDPTSVGDMLRQASDARNRIFVVYLDPVHTTMFDSMSVRPALMDFLTRAMGPSDLFGVMTPEIPVSALTLGRRMESAMSILWTPWGLIENPAEPIPRNRVEERVYECFGPEMLRPYRTHLMFSSLEALIPYLGTLRDERKNLILVTGALRVNLSGTGSRAGAGGPPIGRGGTLTGRGGTPTGPGGTPIGRGGIPPVGVGPGGQLGIGGTERRETGRDTSVCDALAAGMRGIPFDERFRNLLESARNANVSIYPIDTGGLRVTDGGITDTLRTLAENTDGTAIVNTNDLGAGVRKIADELSAYYLLGYSSTNTRDDGGFRRIEVKTTLRGVDVSARKGYFAPTEAMRKAEAAARAAGPRPAPSPAVEAIGALGRLRADARVFAHAVASDRGVDVAVEIAGREIEAGRWRQGADVAVTVTGLAASAGSPAPVSARIEAGARGVLVHLPMAPVAGADPLAIVVSIASGGDVAGGAETKEEYRVDVARSTARVVAAPIVYRATPSPRSPLRPVAEFQFRRTERLHLEWAVVAGPAQRTARLLNAQGQPIAVPIALADRDNAGRTTITADVLLSAIPAGDYVIELVADRDGVSETRLTAFRLVR